MANPADKHPEGADQQANLAKKAEWGEVRRQGQEPHPKPAPPEPWPEDFWKAFEGMPDDFERPDQSGKDPGAQPRETWVEYGPSEGDSQEEDREEADPLP